MIKSLCALISWWISSVTTKTYPITLIHPHASLSPLYKYGSMSLAQCPCVGHSDLPVFNGEVDNMIHFTKFPSWQFGLLHYIIGFICNIFFWYADIVLLCCFTSFFTLSLHVYHAETLIWTSFLMPMRRSQTVNRQSPVVHEGVIFPAMSIRVFFGKMSKV